MIRQWMVALALAICTWNAAEELIARHSVPPGCSTDSECEGVDK